MCRLTLSVHMLIKNEDRFIWYAVNSVLPFADKILIFDTGSRDATLKIIDCFKDDRLEYKKRSIKSPADISKLRQEQIEKTKSDWFWVVDGDEIYPEALSREIISLISSEEDDELEGIVVGRYDLLGDIYHYQDDSAGTYDLFNKRGHFALRLINKKNIPGLYVKGIYPYEGYYDRKGIEIIHHSANKFRFTQGKLFHAMYLSRSSLGLSLIDTYHRDKQKIERGKRFSKDTVYPEVFNFSHPACVPTVTNKRSFLYEILALFITPVKIIKRLVWKMIG